MLFTAPISLPLLSQEDQSLSLHGHSLILRMYEKVLSNPCRCVPYRTDTIKLCKIAVIKMASHFIPNPRSHAVSTKRTILSPFTKEYRVHAANSGIRQFLEEFSDGEAPKNVSLTISNLACLITLDTRNWISRCDICLIYRPHLFSSTKFHPLQPQKSVKCQLHEIFIHFFLEEKKSKSKAERKQNECP